jgi:hypothetical protein
VNIGVPSATTRPYIQETSGIWRMRDKQKFIINDEVIKSEIINGDSTHKHPAQLAIWRIKKTNREQILQGGKTIKILTSWRSNKSVMKDKINKWVIQLNGNQMNRKQHALGQATGRRSTLYSSDNNRNWSVDAIRPAEGETNMYTEVKYTIQLLDESSGVVERTIKMIINNCHGVSRSTTNHGHGGIEIQNGGQRSFLPTITSQDVSYDIWCMIDQKLIKVALEIATSSAGRADGLRHVFKAEGLRCNQRYLVLENGGCMGQVSSCVYANELWTNEEGPSRVFNKLSGAITRVYKRALSSCISEFDSFNIVVYFCVEYCKMWNVKRLKMEDSSCDKENVFKANEKAEVIDRRASEIDKLLSLAN